MMKLPEKVSVLIIGAGPSGLMMAAQLDRFGVDYMIVDKKHGPVQTSNAFGIHARSMEIFDQLGIVQDFLNESRIAEVAGYYVNGKVIAEFEIKGIGEKLTKYPHVYVLEQYKTEQLLVKHIEGQGNEVFWRTEFVEIKGRAPVPLISLRNENGTYEIKADYVIGADGSGSLVRENLKIPFGGNTFPQNFMLADAYLEWNDNPNRNVAICFTPKNAVGFFPFKEPGKYRMFSFMGEGEHAEGSNEQHFIDKVENKMALQIKVKKIIWLSVFKIHSRIVKNYSRGNFFLVGDAAHIHSPAGAQGMNTGFQDAYNLAWKIALVHRGFLSADLLETYEDERKEIAKDVLKNTDNAFQYVISRNPFLRFIRLKIIPFLMNLMLRFPSSRKFAFLRLSQIGVHYFSSKLNINHDPDGLFTSKAPLPGDRFPYVYGSNFHDLMRKTCFFLLCFSKYGHDKLEEIKHWTDSTTFGEIEVIEAESCYQINDLYEEWGIAEPCYFLIRPDMHVAIRSQPGSLKPLQHFFKTWKA